jgi:hypothetical protein
MRSFPAAALLQKYRLPGAAASGGYVQAGVLVSYGPESGKVARQAADIGARILKGVTTIYEVNLLMQNSRSDGTQCLPTFA